MRKTNIQRNQLKFILILNDFYDILGYFKQPFFKLGNKTAQQITNLPIFLSFFVMFLSILQISFDTKNSSILKNYPLFVNLTNKKIPQKFETLYLQLQLEEISKNERLLNDQNSIAFYKNFKTDKPEFPTIYHQIQNSKQKQNTINLYKTFEQIGPILLSEIKKDKIQTLKECESPQGAIIHLGVDIPYRNWSSKTKNFNVTEDKLLTNWRFKDSDLIIKDLKKEKNSEKADHMIQEFIIQYNNYVKEIENKKYISLKNKILPFKSIQMTQNSEKIFIKVHCSPAPLARAWAGWSAVSGLVPPSMKFFLNPISSDLQKRFRPKDFLNNQEFKTQINPILKKNRFAAGSLRSPLAALHQEQNISTKNWNKKDKQQASGEDRLFNFNKISHWMNKKELYEKRLKKKIIQFQKNGLSGKERRIKKIQLNKNLTRRPLSFLHLKVLNINTQLSQILKEAMFVRLPRIPSDPSHIENKLPWTQFEKLQFNSTDIFYQIQEIEDQIPMKIQGSQIWMDTTIPDKTYLFGDNQYQEREYEVITYEKKVWDTLHKKLSNLQLQMPPFMKFVRQHQNNINKRSLLNIKFISQWGQPSAGRQLLKFLELTKKKIPKHSNFLKKIEKYQLKELKSIGQLDIEIQETENNKNFDTQNIYYNLKMRSLASRNKKDLVNTKYFSEKIWLLPKPEFLYFYELFYGDTSLVGEGFFRYPKMTTKNWNQKTIQTTFDNYLKKSSPLLQLQEKNPYLDQVISPEDYLLETLFFFIKQNLTQFKQKNEVPKASARQKGERSEPPAAARGDLDLINQTNLNDPLTQITPSISKILNYLNNRKKQRNIFLINSGRILQIKNLLERKQKIQNLILYNSILNNYLFDPRIFEGQQNLIKKGHDRRRAAARGRVLKGVFQPIVKYISTSQKTSRPFLVNFQKLQKKLFIQIVNRYDSFSANVFFLFEKANFINSITHQNHLSLNLYEWKENLKFQWLWAQRFEKIESAKRIQSPYVESTGLLEGRSSYLPPRLFKGLGAKGLSAGSPGVGPKTQGALQGLEPKVQVVQTLKSKVAIFSPFSLRETSCWVHLIKSHNENTPYECMGKYYFIRKLPKIPKNVDHPIIAIKKTNSLKNSYPYRVINLPIMTPLKKKKINYGKEILSKLNDSRNLQNQLYDQFFSILDTFVSNTANKNDFKDVGPSLNISQNKKFQRTDILENFYNDSEIDQIQKCLGQKQPIYQNKMGPRKMSGYIFPDLERKQLFNLFKLFNQNIELEISISNINVNIDDFLKQLPELQIQRFKNTLQTPFQTFKHQPKISQTRFWNSQFFEFRENLNNYSWSIIFFLSSGWLFINLFKNLYKKYAKEFVESGIDFLKRAGILDDVQWIKEELGMAPIDKGYRGIRHPGIQRKKFKNIIGLERKHIISQVSEMVWFLKTKKLMKSTSIDPFVQVILLLNRHYDSLITKTTKIRLMEKWLAKIPPSPPSYVLKEKSPSYAIIQENLRILFPESKAYQTIEISPQQKETLRPFRFILEELTNENENENENEKNSRTKIKNDDISLALALKRNRNQVKPKGFLFTGPPGTGKTLLVQAIAGETSVPVVTQSGGLLQNPRLRGKGARTLHKLFLRAREIAPCIIFIDEIDGIGTRRQFLPLYIDIYGRYDPIEWLESEEAFFPPKIYQTKLQRRAEFLDDHDPYWEEPEFTQTVQSTRIPIDVLQDLQFSRGARSEQLSMLTQLLIEMDGLHSLENILVIGATNRLEILDPALMRPGRFQRILRFNLPNYHARINLLKLYTHASKIGIENISWDYFSKRTHGLSSADIASIVFASELTAIQQSKTHTFETLERGIDLITSFPDIAIQFRLKNIFIFLENSIHKFFEKNHFHSIAKIEGEPVLHPHSYVSIPLQETSNIYRNCYYNIGKLVVLFCLQIMPFSSAYMSLWIRPKNFRFFFFTKNYEFDEFDQKMFSRKEIEKRLLAFFGGKAAESLFIFLPLHKFSSEIYFHFDPTFLSINNSLEQSNFGIDNEIQTAQNLLKLMVEKWYFYLERIATEKFHPILENANLWEYSEKEILLSQALIDEMIIDLDMRNRLSKNEQKYSYQTWWMKKVATQLNYREFNFILKWSRIFLSDSEDSAQNIEWVAPDEYFHTILRTRPDCMAWTHFLENGRFAISNLLLLQSFNTVFKTLRQFSEFMDFLADYFLRYECIREIEFQTKISQFFNYLLPEITLQNSSNTKNI